MSTRRPSGLDEYDSVGDREREEPSTPIRETLAVADRRKTKETAGGGEELEADAEVGSKAGEARITKQELCPAEGQEASTDPEEPQRVTDDDG